MKIDILTLFPQMFEGVLGSSILGKAEEKGLVHFRTVNTVVNENGKWIGYNTDGIGYIRSLKEETGVALNGKNIVMIGAGGAARAIVYRFLKEKVASCVILNRTYSRAEALAKELESHGPVEAVRWEDREAILTDADLVVNSTSVGMVPEVDASPLNLEDLNRLSSHTIVSDLIYNPRETLLLKEASARGLTIHGGLGMFLYQGAYAFEYWTGAPAPIEAMKQAIDSI